jgi:hypothetical protein
MTALWPSVSPTLHKDHEAPALWIADAHVLPHKRPKFLAIHLKDDASVLLFSPGNHVFCKPNQVLLLACSAFF